MIIVNNYLQGDEPLKKCKKGAYILAWNTESNSFEEGVIIRKHVKTITVRFERTKIETKVQKQILLHEYAFPGVIRTIPLQCTSAYKVFAAVMEAKSGV